MQGAKPTTALQPPAKRKPEITISKEEAERAAQKVVALLAAKGLEVPRSPSKKQAESRTTSGVGSTAAATEATAATAAAAGSAADAAVKPAGQAKDGAEEDGRSSGLKTNKALMPASKPAKPKSSGDSKPTGEGAPSGPKKTGEVKALLRFLQQLIIDITTEPYPPTMEKLVSAVVNAANKNHSAATALTTELDDVLRPLANMYKSLNKSQQLVMGLDSCECQSSSISFSAPCISSR